MLLLTSESRRRARRRRLADGLEAAVRRAHGRRNALSAEIPVARHAVLDQEERLLELAVLLRSRRRLPDEGLRAVDALLTDGAGPLFVEDRDLPSAVTRVMRRLGLA